MSMPCQFRLPWCCTLPYTPNPKTWAKIAQWNKYLQVLFWAGLDMSLPPPLPSSLTLPAFCCWKTGISSQWRSGRYVKSIKSPASLAYIELWFTNMPLDKFLTGQLRYLQSLIWRYSVVPLPLTSDDSLGIWSACELSWFESKLCHWYRWIHKDLKLAFCLEWDTNKKKKA